MSVDPGSSSGRWICLAVLLGAASGCGAPDEPLGRSAQPVSAFVFKQGPAPLVASDAQSFEEFGHAVAVSSRWAAVGAPAHDWDPSNIDDNTGSATVFERKQGNSWEEVASLAPEQAWPDARFGATIAATDSLVVLGAPDADPSPDGSKFGAGVVASFAYTSGQWLREPLLRDPNEDADRVFGAALALDDTTLLVGAYGADQVFAYTRTQAGWSTPVTIDSPSPLGGFFGYSVALDAPYAFIGAPFDDDGNAEDDDRGAVFVYEHQGSAWTLRGTLQRNLLGPGDLFGAAVAARNHFVVASAYGDSSVVAFRQDAQSAWTDPRRLVSSLAGSNDAFGSSLAFGVKDSIWVGASREDDYQGVVYPFLRADDGWDEDQEVTFVQGGQFGYAVASASGGLMVGAPRAGEGEPGAVYVIETSDGSPCDDDAECFSTHCVVGVCCNTACDQVCQSCLSSEKASGSADGTCEPIRKGTLAPNGGCVDQGSRSCGTNGLCDGAGKCQSYAAGTECGDPFCSGDDLVGPALCDGKGDCRAADATGCGNYACSDAACQDKCGTDKDCGPSAYCNDGRCRPRRGLGAACSAAAECLQGFCADGVCCDQACDGECEACDQSGSCKPKDAGSAPRTAPASDTSGDARCAELYCDGATPGAPTLPTASGEVCSPAGCTDGVEVAEGTCDGSGRCVAPTMNQCGAYACSRTERRMGRPERCLTSCDSVSDCALDYYCTTDHECQPIDGAEHSSQSCSVGVAGGATNDSCFGVLVSAMALLGLRRRPLKGRTPS